MEACVHGMGGLLVRDLLAADPGMPNADFWFPDHKVIVEMKRLTSDGITQQKMQSNCERLVHDGKVKTDKDGKVGLHLLSAPMRDEVLKPLKSRLRRRLERSNTQIKSLREQTFGLDARGVLLLINDGEYDLRPDMIRWMLPQAAGNSYKSIAGVIHLTATDNLRSPIWTERFGLWAVWNLANRPPVSISTRHFNEHGSHA